MTKEQIQLLVEKYIDGSATPHEREELLKWYRAANNRHIKLIAYNESEDEVRLRMLANITRHTTINSKPAKHLWRWIAAAASILLFISAGAYFILHKNQPSQMAGVHVQTPDVMPGGNKAVLTLANGNKISLSDAKNGSIASQGHIIISKTADGKLVYQPGRASVNTLDAGNISYNTISTPRGGHYNLVMADGTVAVLDAASSIKYPVAFTGRERTVEITGQVYFEVVHNDAKPFSVKIKGETIEDLGTHFNINAYDDEPLIKTTLLEGSIQVSLNKGAKTKDGVKLNPGQQAVTSPLNNSIIVKDVDTDEAVAWKNGYFQFTNESLESIMRKISRWYDVSVEYRNNSLKSKVFNGTISKYRNISQVLKVLEFAGETKFEIKGNKTIIVI
jgi:transmembrane sensor